MGTVNELLGIARKQIGVSEAPPDSNNVRYNTWYYGREVMGSWYPWCMVFCKKLNEVSSPIGLRAKSAWKDSLPSMALKKPATPLSISAYSYPEGRITNTSLALVSDAI